MDPKHALREDSDEEESSGDEIWLISYSDMMTLLFGFFLLMYVFAMTRTGAQVEAVKQGVARSFGGSYVVPYKALRTQLEDFKRHQPLLQDIAIEKLRDGLEITFQSGLIFPTGSAELTPETRRTIHRIAQIISDNVRKSHLVIEGHTDDVPIHSAQFPSNWELSSARASAVVREFLKAGFDPGRIMAVGYADSRPLFPNEDENDVPIPENRERNRRVVIKVVAPGYVQAH